jgi:hypothetical protein
VYSVECNGPFSIHSEQIGETFDHEHLSPELPKNEAEMAVRDICLRRTASWHEYIVRVEADSRAVLGVLTKGAYAVFVDGDHGKEAAMRDIRSSIAAGVEKLLVHDWLNDAYHGVQRACEDVLGEPDNVIDSMAVWEHPKERRKA